MIVRCPECSTGFKLPESKVSQEGVKLRCSKCSHVFRFRVDADGEAEIFYADGDLEKGAQTSEATDTSEASRQADAEADDKSEEPEAGAANRTQFGMPAVSMSKPKPIGSTALGAKLARSLSKSASADYNPFPHANLDAQPPGQTGLGLQPARADEPEAEDEKPLEWQDEATRLIDVNQPDSAPTEPGPEDAQPDPQGAPQALRADDTPTGEQDPFGDAFADEVQDAAADIFDNASAPAAAQDPQAPGPSPQPSSALPEPTAQPEPEAAAAQAEAAAVGAAAGATPFQMRDSGFRAEEMVDPSFGQSGPKFDPERGIITDESPAPQTQAARPAPAPASAAPRPAPAATQPAQQPEETRAPAQNTGSWNADPIDDDILAPHRIGGGGAQKAANILLILLIVLFGFFGLIAALSGGFLDLKRFSHTLEVAFQGADFKPRAEWAKPAKPQIAAAPEDPIRLESVFATPVELEQDGPLILVRGSAKNLADHGFDNIRLRAILYDKNERVLTETTGYLGANIHPAQLAEAASGGGVSALLAQEESGLASRSAQAFSLVFEEVPAELAQNAEISYRVEVADKTPDATAAASE